MNQNRRVVVFTLFAVALLLALSFLNEMKGSSIFALGNVSIFSDLIIAPKTKKDSFLNRPAAAITAGIHDTLTDFRQYTTGGTIFHFNAASNQPALLQFAQKLAALKASKKGKIRIAWLGDSMIEGDLVTQTFRRRMQEAFGGAGVGFVPIQSATADFRNTVRHHWSGGWKEENFKSDTHTAPLFFSGHVYFGTNGSVTYSDKTTKDSNLVLIKTLLCGPAANAVSVSVNGAAHSYFPHDAMNQLLLDTSVQHEITTGINEPSWPVYGISMESTDGIIVDNFSFRGTSGVELARIDTTLLVNLMKNKDYDLVVLEYGANLMYHPDDKDYRWFHRKMQPILAKFKNNLPGAELLLISTADRAFKYGDEWQTATGIDSLLQMQAQLAYDNNISFFNMYATMGGEGTIVKWADSSTALANKDYIHPNNRGAEVLGNLIFDAMMKDFKKMH